MFTNTWGQVNFYIYGDERVQSKSHGRLYMCGIGYSVCSVERKKTESG